MTPSEPVTLASCQAEHHRVDQRLTGIEQTLEAIWHELTAERDRLDAQAMRGIARNDVNATTLSDLRTEVALLKGRVNMMIWMTGVAMPIIAAVAVAVGRTI